jgi:hypothetical protein
MDEQRAIQIDPNGLEIVPSEAFPGEYLIIGHSRPVAFIKWDEEKKSWVIDKCYHGKEITIDNLIRGEAAQYELQMFKEPGTNNYLICDADIPTGRLKQVTGINDYPTWITEPCNMQGLSFYEYTNTQPEK